MFNRFAPILLLGLVPACSAAPSSEAPESSLEAVTPATSPALSNLNVISMATSMVFTYGASGPAFAIALTGPGGATKTTSVTATGQSAEFDGLTPCTPYTWSIQSASGVVASGATNTRLSGLTGVCPTSEAILATSHQDFEGAEHVERQNFGCGNWTYTSWPIGYGWREGSYSDPDGHTIAEFGYQHWDNGSPNCDENVVQVWRAQLEYVVSPDQWSRGVTNATFNATYTSGSPTNCVTRLSTLYATAWPQHSDGALWAGIVGGPETDKGLVETSAQPTYPIVVSGNQMTVNLGTPLYATIFAGFQADDGFADISAGATQSWADDNDKCLASIENAALTLQYEPLPPETPISCTGSIACGGTTVMCNWSPEVIQLLESDATQTNRVVATMDATGGSSITLSDPAGVPGDAYQVCTVSSAGARACSPVSVTSVVACPAIPACTMATTCTNTATPPTMTVTCGGAAEFYTDDTYTGTITFQTDAQTFTRTTDTYTTNEILACAPGFGPTSANPRCATPFSTYVPKTSWCGRPPPPPSCPGKPIGKCSVAWKCCGSDGWSCGVCQ